VITFDSFAGNVNSAKCSLQVVNVKLQCQQVRSRVSISSPDNTHQPRWTIQNLRIRILLRYSGRYPAMGSVRYPDPDSATLDPNPDPNRCQNLIDWSLGHAPPLQKFHQNPFITCTCSCRTLQNVSLQPICYLYRILQNGPGGMGACHCPPLQLEISICLRLLGAYPSPPPRGLCSWTISLFCPPPRSKFLATPLSRIHEKIRIATKI